MPCAGSHAHTHTKIACAARMRGAAHQRSAAAPRAGYHYRFFFWRANMKYAICPTGVSSAGKSMACLSA